MTIYSAFPPCQCAACRSLRADPTHDDLCESEFISGANAMTPCACEGRHRRSVEPAAERVVTLVVALPTYCKGDQVEAIARAAAKNIYHSVNAKATVLLRDAAQGPNLDVTYVRSDDYESDY